MSSRTDMGPARNIARQKTQARASWGLACLVGTFDSDLLEVFTMLDDLEAELMRERRRPPAATLPLCGARRRDGGACQMRAVCDRLTGRPLHRGRCRLHGGA